MFKFLKGGRGGGGFGGFRGASAARAASGARLSSAKIGSSGSRGSYGGYGGGTYIYAGGSHHSPGNGNWPKGPSDIIFVVILLVGSAVFLICFCSYLSKSDATEREKEFIPPKRYPQPPKQKVYTHLSLNDKCYQQQRHLPPPIYEI
uniref:Uncharacterized protein n=1 Tax=Panagrolaimus sp. ES5 TaxID=591445 RepID=A0AC34FSQ0_9BILA